MTSNITQKLQGKWFYIASIALTLLMPMLPVWGGPVGAGYVFACFVLGVLSGVISLRSNKSIVATLLVIPGWFLLKDLFFDMEDLHEFYWSVIVQGGTTLLVAQLGVGLLYERQKQNAQLNQSNNQLTS